MANDSRTLLNMSDHGVKRMAVNFIKGLNGLYWFECVRARDQRSLAQNAYLWGVVYKAVQSGISQAWGENLAIEEIHIMLREKFLAKPIVNRKTGEVMHNGAGSTAALDKSQFAEYLDQVIKFSADYLGVEVPEAGDSYSREPIPETPGGPAAF